MVCFLCTSWTPRVFPHSGHVTRQIDLFKDLLNQTALDKGFLPDASSSLDFCSEGGEKSCSSCLTRVGKVWELNREILALQEQIKTIVVKSFLENAEKLTGMWLRKKRRKQILENSMTPERDKIIKDCFNNIAFNCGISVASTPPLREDRAPTSAPTLRLAQSCLPAASTAPQPLRQYPASKKTPAVIAAPPEEEEITCETASNSSSNSCQIVDNDDDDDDDGSSTRSAPLDDSIKNDDIVEGDEAKEWSVHNNDPEVDDATTNVIPVKIDGNDLFLEYEDAEEMPTAASEPSFTTPIIVSTKSISDHYVMYEGPRPFGCGKCSGSFATKAWLFRHMNTCKGPTCTP